MIEVVCAVIVSEDKIFVAQRSELMTLPLKWEFPGGKKKEFESAEECIKRELIEELNINVEVIRKLRANVHDYKNFRIKLIPYIVRIKSGKILLMEHKTSGWFRLDELENLDWAAADIPIVNELNLSLL